MFSPWLLFLTAFCAGMIILMPTFDRAAYLLARSSRMILLHWSCALRNMLVPWANPRVKGMDADSKALEELLRLYYPPLCLKDTLTNDDVQHFRRRAKQLFTSLYPARTSACRVRHHIFQYDENKVNTYLIEYAQEYNWKDPEQPIVLYFHGGGFVFGDIDLYSGIECDLSKHLNMPVFHVEFGHVPEYPLEKILQDTIDVYHVLLHVDRNIHRRLIGMGDSSGGMLWIHLLQWLVDNHMSVPQGVVLHSPWPSLNFDYLDTPVFSDIYLSTRHVVNLKRLAIGNDTDWDDLSEEEQRKLSAKEDSYQGFPPLYITIGADEVFNYAIHRMISVARTAGGNVVVDVAEGMMHAFPLYYLWSSRAKCAQEKAFQWIRQQLPTMVRLREGSKRQLQ